MLEENAFFSALRVFQTSIEPAYAVDILDQGMQLFSSYGYTTAQEGRGFASSLATAEARAQRGALPIDVALYLDYTVKDQMVASPYYGGAGYEGIGYTNGFRIAGVKLTIDGSPQLSLIHI